MARFCSLFSGSKGNSYYIGNSDGSGILVDVGVSAKRIEKALNDREIDPRSIQSIFITHEHTDHVAGLRVLAKRYDYKIYSSKGTLDTLIEKNVIESYHSYGIIEEKGVTIGDMHVKSFDICHDCAEGIGFRIETDDNRLIGFATDTGEITEDIREGLSSCDLVLIESNHDVRMLENGHYPYFLKRRILGKNGHLSNEVCANELPKLAESGTTRFVLGHLSQENNFPDLALETAKGFLNNAGMDENRDYLIEVAKQDCNASCILL